MKLHPRTQLVAAASLEAREYLLEWSERHGLTAAEVLSVISQVMAMFVMLNLREERHPGEPNKKADEA